MEVVRRKQTVASHTHTQNFQTSAREIGHLANLVPSLQFWQRAYNHELEIIQAERETRLMQEIFQARE